jgi:hypothetical protein
MQDFFKRSGIDSVEIKNSEDFILKLVDFLRRRIKKRRLV